MTTVAACIVNVKGGSSNIKFALSEAYCVSRQIVAGAIISAAESTVGVRVIGIDEEIMVAKSAIRILDIDPHGNCSL